MNPEDTLEESCDSHDLGLEDGDGVSDMNCLMESRKWKK